MPKKKASKPKIAKRKTPKIMKQPKQKGILKKVLLAIGGVFALLIVLISIFILPSFLRMKNFTSSATGKIDGELYAVNDKFVSIFVLQSGKDLIAFDAGNDIKNIEAGFKKLGFDTRMVKAVFLTHSDRDHVNALPLFKNATIYLPEKEEPYITGTAKRKFLFIKMANRLPMSKYTLIKDSKEIKFAKSRIKAILTPGHTSGSTSYLVNGKYLIVGDLALVGKGKLVPMPVPPSENMDILEKSLKLVESIKGIKFFATAHTGILKKQ
jgi:glyoxylase-like metal-dependent hydrolase (beta-lactamase superfamily II)